MRSATLKNWILVILLISAGFRIGFLLSGDVLPVMWDARRYAAAAIGLISLVDDSGSGEFADTREDRYRFKHYYDKYLQGEKIEWFYYSPHTLTKARDDLFFAGPLYPAVLAIIIGLSPAADFTVVRLFGIVFDLLANWLLILIGIRLVGRKAALIAGLLYAVYFPFVVMSTMLLLETSTSLLILVAIYLLIRAFEDDRKSLYLWAGVVSGLLILNKPTAMLLGVPLVIGYWLYARSQLAWKTILNRLLLVAVPLAIIFIAWLSVTSANYGQLALREPTYGDSNLRQATSVEFEGYALDRVDEEYWTRSIAGDILDDPGGYAGLLAKKFNRLWSRPYNDFKRSFIMPYGMIEYFHLVIVIAGLLGLLLLIGRGFDKAGWPVLIVGYYAAVHLVFHAIPRYNFNAMPMVILAAAALMASLAGKWKEADRPTRGLLTLGIGLLILGFISDHKWSNQVFGTGLSSGLVWMVTILKGVLVVVGLALVGKVLSVSGRLSSAGLMPVVAGAIILVGMGSAALSDARWAEFSCRLDKPQMKAGTRLYISRLEEVKNDETLALLIDLNSGPGRQNSFDISVGDSAWSLIGGHPPLSDYFYPKATYKYYSQLIPIGIEEWRQYAMIPVSDSLVLKSLTEFGYLDVSVAINSNFPEKNNYVTLYGNYQHGERGRYVPSIRHTSIERYVSEGDPRIRYFVNSVSDSAKSYYIERNGTVTTTQVDLSDSPGVQTGLFNIFLVHFKPDGSFTVY